MISNLHGYVKMMTFELSLQAYTYIQYEDEKWVIIDKDGRINLLSFGTGLYSTILVIYEEVLTVRFPIKQSLQVNYS